MRPSMASPIYDIRPAYSQRIAIGYETLAPRSRQDTPATNTARDPNLGSANHDMSRLSALAYPNDAPIHGLTDIRLAYSQRILGVTPPPLALGAQALQHTLLATQTSAVATTTCLDYLNFHAQTMRPSTDPRPCRQTSTPALNGYWVWCPRPSLTDQTHTTPQLWLYYNALTAEKLRTCISWLLSPDEAHLHAHRSLRCTTSNGYWVWHPAPAPRPQTTPGNTNCLRPKPRQWQPRHVY
jgi:hypothetical protein